MWVDFNVSQDWVLRSYLSHQDRQKFGQVVLHVSQHGQDYVFKFLNNHASIEVRQRHLAEISHYQNNDMVEIILTSQVRTVPELFNQAFEKRFNTFLHHEVLILPFAETIKSYLKQHHQSLAFKINLFKQMCKVVSTLHQLGFIHGDLKLAHFVFEGDQIKIIDLANLQCITRTTGVQTDGGTPAYMAPELYLGQHKSIQSDIYAMGVIFYQLLMGERPYQAKSYMEWARAHCQQDIPLLNDELKIYQVLLDGMLAKHLKHRFTSLSFVENALNFS